MVESYVEYPSGEASVHHPSGESLHHTANVERGSTVFVLPRCNPQRESDYGLAGAAGCAGTCCCALSGPGCDEPGIGTAEAGRFAARVESAEPRSLLAASSARSTPASTILAPG